MLDGHEGVAREAALVGARPRPPTAHRRRGATPASRSCHSIAALCRRRGGPTPCGPAGAPPAPKPARRPTVLEPRPRGHPASPTSSGASDGLAVCMGGVGPSARAQRQRSARGRLGFVHESVTGDRSIDRPLVRRTTAVSAAIWSSDAPYHVLSDAPRVAVVAAEPSATRGKAAGSYQDQVGESTTDGRGSKTVVNRSPQSPPSTFRLKYSDDANCDSASLDVSLKAGLCLGPLPFQGSRPAGRSRLQADGPGGGARLGSLGSIRGTHQLSQTAPCGLRCRVRSGNDCD